MAGGSPPISRPPTRPSISTSRICKRRHSLRRSSSTRSRRTVAVAFPAF
jgi:hypothetical protein